MNVFVRLSGDLPVMEKSFFRNLVAFFFALMILKRSKTELRIERTQLPFLFLRSILGTAGILCNFYAVDHLLVADASMLNKLSPFFVIIFSIFILREKVTLPQFTFICIAFVGCLFVIKPGVLGMEVVPALIGLCGGICAGGAYTFVRYLGNHGVAGPIIVLFFSAFSCLSMIPGLLLHYQPMSFAQFLCLLMTGLCAAGGQFSITAAYTHAPAREISIYDYTQIIFSTILGFLFFAQMPDGYSFLGYFIICAASVGMFIYNNKKENVVK
jgi:drug/metabolite transporter (DMT)-like permease